MKLKLDVLSEKLQISGCQVAEGKFLYTKQKFKLSFISSPQQLIPLVHLNFN